MAASTLAITSVGSAVSTPVRGPSKLASKDAFGSSLVQVAPVRSAVSNGNRVVAVRANLSEDQQTSGKKVLASFLAAGAALSIAGQALAGNPIDIAKNKADDVVSSAKSATASLPDLPSLQAPNLGGLQDAQDAAGSLVQQTKGRIDGLFGANKGYPFKQGRVASTNGGTGSAFGDAKKRIENFGKNPIAENLGKTTQEFKDNIGQATGENSGSALAAKEFLGKDSRRVDAATQKVKGLQENFKGKAGDALDEAKRFVGAAKDATPNLPTPSLPNLPNAGSAVEGAKNLVGSAQDATSNIPNAPSLPNSLPNPFDKKGNNKGLQRKAADVKNTVASKVDNVKGDVSSKFPSSAGNQAGDAMEGAKNAAESATNKLPSLPNPFKGSKIQQIGRGAQKKVSDVTGEVASKVDDVKGDISSQASNNLNKNAGEAAGDAKNFVGSAAQDATSNFSIPNPFEGLTKNTQDKVDDVKGNVSSKFENVKGDVASKGNELKGDLSSKASSSFNGKAGEAIGEAKDYVGSAAQDTSSAFPNIPNPFEAFSKNTSDLKGAASDAKDNVASKAEQVKEDVSSKASSILQ